MNLPALRKSVNYGFSMGFSVFIIITIKPIINLPSRNIKG